MTSIESIPQVWDDERDGEFFRITASLFDQTFCCGAGVLLASYDGEDEFAAAAVSFAQLAPAPSTSLDKNVSTVKGATR